MKKSTKIIYTIFLIPVFNLFFILFIDYCNFKCIASLLSNNFYENILLDLIQTPIAAAGIVLYTFKFTKNWDKRYFHSIHLTNIILWCCLWIATYIKSVYTIYIMYSLKYYLLWFFSLIILEFLCINHKRKYKA